MWPVYTYLVRRWRQVAASALLVAIATYIVIVSTVLLGANHATRTLLEKRVYHLVKVTGMISEAELLELLPDEKVEIIPAAVAYLRYPLLFGRSTVLPVYGMTQTNAEKLLAITGGKVTADTIIPELNGLYVPERLLQARNTALGDELKENYLGTEFSFHLSGLIESPFDFALAARDTIANLPLQEPALLVYADSMDSQSLEAVLQEKLGGRKNVQVSGPSYFTNLARERSSEVTILSTISLLIVGAILTSTLLVFISTQQLEFAVEQAVARLYQNGVQASLIRPLVVGTISGISGWVLGAFGALLTYLIGNDLFMTPRGMVAALPQKWTFISAIYILLPIICQILTWSGPLRIDPAVFLARVPTPLLPKTEAVETSNRPSKSVGF